jgi:thiosulfate/3-mercaptopyruvate sulfurtransferase
LTGNLGLDGCFLGATTLRERFVAALGGQSPKRVVHMCGSGVTACHNLLAMEVAGLTGSRLYAGSWSEWIRDPNRPVAKD